MANAANRALIVDDEAGVRFLVSRSLREEGFACDHASDGNEAASRLQDCKYDVVVTDLRMPGRHGHALACEMLTRPDRPLVVVLTSCTEPRLIKDLIARGVEDVSFKPVDFRAFAGKVRALVSRHERSAVPISLNPNVPLPDEDFQIAEIQPVTHADYELQLHHVSQFVSLSPFALDVFHLVNSGDQDAEDVVKLVLRDGVLTAELLKLANSSFYNPAGTPIVNVLDAIVRVGFRRVGTIALAASARASMAKCALPWLDAELSWSRSLGAVIAAAYLEEQGQHRGMGDGPFLAALLHPLGRVALGAQFPLHYEQLIRSAETHAMPLRDLECLAFPETHSAALARVLSNWDLPTEILQPLRHSAERWDAMEYIPEPIRLHVELVKLAILISRLALPRWNSWDLVDFPSCSTLERLRVRDLGQLVNATRADLKQIMGAAAENRSAGKQFRTGGSPARRCLRYCNLSDEPFDFVAPLLNQMGYELEEIGRDVANVGDQVIINCQGTASWRATTRMDNSTSPTRLMLVAESDRLSGSLNEWGEVLNLPTSFSQLQASVERVASQTSAAQPVGNARRSR